MTAPIFDALERARDRCTPAVLDAVRQEGNVEAHVVFFDRTTGHYTGWVTLSPDDYAAFRLELIGILRAYLAKLETGNELQ